MKSGKRCLWNLSVPAFSALAILFAATTAVSPPLQAATVASEEGAEIRACAKCHANEVERFSANPHATTNKPGGKDDVCSGCHGPSAAHIASGGDPSKVLNFAQMKTSQVNQLCLRCHGGGEAAFEHSEHGKAHLSCTSCHSIHAAGHFKLLLKASTTELCFQCHAEVKSQFSAPSHHKVEEGLIECTDCHNPHGPSGKPFQPDSVRQTAACTNCHTQTAGPFTYEHAPMQTEGCTACHVGHSGPNPNLLIRAKVDAICEQCHFPAPDSASGAHLNPGIQSASTTKTCITCHVDIHGSNSSMVFLRKK